VSAPTTFPVIALLDPTVANQIAAGEVVERPASVVKELVENSLDAGATRIQVRLHDGGKQRIQVIDNGCGLDGPSARLAFARHATSKLRRAEDLGDLHTFGFRGEALASILAVADITLTSRRADMAVGVRLVGGGSVALAEEPAGCPVGTDLVVANLFAHVPARLKFLRTPATELGQVLRFLDALALARPDLHLSLHHNDRKVCDYPPDADLRRRAHAVLGKDVALRLYAVEDTLEYEVRGLLSEPGLHHAGPGQLVLLVNGRPVADRTLQHAIAAAYGTLLERGRYPVGVLSLRCPPDTVDVNVHPAKTEVRFVASQDVHAAVHRALRAMLAATPWVKASVAPVNAPVVPHQADRNSAGSATPDARAEAPQVPDVAGQSYPVAAGYRHAAPSRTAPTWTAGWSARATASDALAPAPSQAELPVAATGPYSSLRYVGQVGRCFLVCETEGAMILIDQHAAHERILFEQFVTRARSGGFASQRLLIPVIVPLAPAEVGALAEAGELLAQLGFDVEVSGERSVRLRAHPSALANRDPGAEVRAIAASLVEGGRGRSTTELLERSAATLACHAAVRAGDWMEPGDVADLLRQMDAVDLSGYCPHGRPAVLRARLDEVGRWFHRS